MKRPFTQTILYLDQNAVSNLVLARTGSTSQTDGFWSGVHDAIVRAVNAGGLICPVSLNHQLESAMWSRLPDLVDTMQGISDGWSFDSFDNLRIHQLLTCFEAALAGRTVSWLDLAHSVLARGPVPLYPLPPKELEALRAQNDQRSKEVNATFDWWKQQQPESLEQWYESEFCVRRDGYVDLLLGYLPSSHHEAARRFMSGAEVRAVPFLSIQAWMSATLTKKALGQVRPPSPGFLADLDMISLLSPYCHAMFVDREMHSYWEELSRTGRIASPTRIFSLRSKDPFVDFLRDLGC